MRLTWKFPQGPCGGVRVFVWGHRFAICRHYCITARHCVPLLAGPSDRDTATSITQHMHLPQWRAPPTFFKHRKAHETFHFAAHLQYPGRSANTLPTLPLGCLCHIITPRFWSSIALVHICCHIVIPKRDKKTQPLGDRHASHRLGTQPLTIYRSSGLSTLPTW